MQDDARKFNTESKDADPRAGDQDDAAGYFGDCPICHRNDGYVNSGSSHWFVCLTHKTKWCIGTNLFSSAMEETPEQQRQEQETLGFDSFGVVEPFYPPPPSANDATTTHDKRIAMSFANKKQRIDDVIPVEQQPSVTDPSTATPEDQTEDLDIAFDDPRLEAAGERETKRSRDTLERKFESLERLLSDAAKVTGQIKALVHEDPE